MNDRLGAYLELAASPDDEFLRRAYRLVLRRDPEPAAAAAALGKLRAGTLSRAALLSDLVLSSEGQLVRTLDDALARAATARAHAERPRLLTGPPGTSERVIEIPWALGRYRGERRVLDIGYAHAEPAWLAGLLAAVPAGVVGVDLVEADVPGFESVAADVRQLPLSDRSFDIAFCLSTLEHVGRDTARYGVAAASLGGPAEALRELRRVLAGNGRLLVSVPCGEHEEHDWFVQREPDDWRSEFERAGFWIHELELYELRPDGWRSAEAFEPSGVRYQTAGPGATAVLCAELRLGRARRAIELLRRRASAARHGAAGPG